MSRQHCAARPLARKKKCGEIIFCDVNLSARKKIKYVKEYFIKFFIVSERNRTEWNTCVSTSVTVIKSAGDGTATR